jgi:hypothetical protein
MNMKSVANVTNRKPARAKWVSGTIHFYHAATPIDEDDPVGSEPETDACREKRLLRYVQASLFRGKKNVSITLKDQEDCEFADFHFTVRFRFGGGGAGFAAAVRKLVCEDYAGKGNWQEFDASDDAGLYYLSEEDFCVADVFDVALGASAEGMRSLAHLARVAPLDRDSPERKRTFRTVHLTP